jgi:MFS family permease
VTAIQRATRRRLPAPVAFFLLASIVVSFLAGSSAPTPLYSVYQAEWGFSPITTTVVFGVYALAVLLALLVVGSLSDHVGRRPILLVSILVQAVIMIAFAHADGVGMLLVARVIQGLSTGAAVGAVGAGMLDLDRVKGTVANSVAAPLGTATGALVSGLLVQFLPAPTHLVYYALAAVFVVQFLGVALMRESAAPQPGALASLRVQIGLPKDVRRPFLLAAPALVAAWSIAGLYGALGPSLIKMLIGHTSYVLGGLSLFTAAFAGALAVLALRNATPRTVMIYGTSALFVGIAVTLVAVETGSAAVFFLGTVIAGTGFGSGFQGAIRSVVPLAASHERAGVLSLVYVVSYLAMGLPAVIAGFLVVDGGGLLDTTREYMIAVMILAAVALLGALRPAAETAAPRDEALSAADLSEAMLVDAA